MFVGRLLIIHRKYFPGLLMQRKGWKFVWHPTYIYYPSQTVCTLEIAGADKKYEINKR